jgi:hypothetical protein
VPSQQKALPKVLQSTPKQIEVLKLHSQDALHVIKSEVVPRLCHYLFNFPITQDSFQPPRNDMDSFRISILHDRLNGLYAPKKSRSFLTCAGVNKNSGLCIK